MRDIIMGVIPYPAKERVESKLCPGTECQEIKPSTNDKGKDQASEKALYPTLRGRAAEYCTRYITGGALLREVSSEIYRKEGQAPKEEFYMGY